jgi:hypothetical protein
MRVYGATLNCLQDEWARPNPQGTKNKAKELLRRMTTCKNLLGFRALMYLTQQLFICSKTLQKQDITYEEAIAAIEVCH